MQNVQYFDQSHQSVITQPHPFHHNASLNNYAPPPQTDVQHQYLDNSSHLQHFMPYPPSLADPSSLPPSGLMNSNPSNRRNSTRPQPPILQIQDQAGSNGYVIDSPGSCYDQSSGSPQHTLQTPTTPSSPAVYMNDSAMDSVTSFSSSSTSSGELEASDGSSSVVASAPFANTNEGLVNRSFVGAERKKRNSRRIWTHSLEKYIFTPHEIATLGTPHRRTIYSASLEAHIDRLHSQLLGVGLYPVHFDALEMYRGLNCKIAKGMIAGLQHDFIQVRRRLLEIERATNNAREMAAMRANHGRIGAQGEVQGNVDQIGRTRRHSLESTLASAGGLSSLP